MTSGVSGDLLSRDFLDAHVSAPAAGPLTRADVGLRGVVQWWRRTTGALGPASAPRSVLDIGARPLLDLLDLQLTRVERHPWGHAGLLTYNGETVATLLCPSWGTAPAAAWRLAVHSTLASHVPWALVFNGASLSVVDATRPWARRYLAFDLAAVCRDPCAIRTMRTLLGGPALHGGAAGILGRAIVASDTAGLAVCAALGAGVLDALQALMHEIGAAAGGRAGQRRDRNAFEQSLTIVYRLLFLLFAEARDLVPLWHRVYRDAYSVDALCGRLLENSAAPGTWSTVQAMARLAHAGCQADDLHVTAFNGRLFAPGRTPFGESGRVRDAAAARAVLALGTTASRSGRRRVLFRDLGVEQLGAVYERVLDYEPVREHRGLGLRQSSNERKTTGSFYTPRPMTDFLVRRTLAPLVDGRSADQILALRVLDPAMGSGAFLVAACRFLAERAEQARITDGIWAEGDITDAERVQLSRLVAERCLYGIDRNPTAVQLARLSLWLTTLAAERPLTFLDHHLAAGNSLIGANVADLPLPPAAAGRPVARDHQLTLFGDDAREAWGRAVVPERHRLAVDPSDSAADVRAKERRFEELMGHHAATRGWARAADLWCGVALQQERVSPGLYADMQRFVSGQATALPASELRGRVERAIACARTHDATHWELLFPEAFFAATGDRRDDAGFDAVIGNPPWEMLRADSGRDRRASPRDETAAVMRFIRASGHYPLHGSGHVNEYQLFLERTLQALAPGGRFGLILPAGVQSDVGSGGLRRALFDRADLDTWLTFDNRRAIFPIHRSVRFVLLAGTGGGRTTAVRLVDGGTDPSILAQLPDNWRHEPADGHVAVTRAFLERWDPANLTVPRVTTPVAMSVAARALEAPPLGHGDGWGIAFGRELNASDNRADLVSVTSRAHTGLVPVLEGKHLRPFAVDVAAASWFISRRRAAALLGDRWRRPRVCYRDVASSTNKVTLMAAVMPAGVVSTHTVFCASAPLSTGDAWCLAALLNSLVANYLVRLQMTTHVTAALMARLPVPRPRAGTPAHDSLSGGAHALSGRGSIEEAADDYARLDAVVAHLYGLTPLQYDHVVSTFPLLPEPLRARCLQQFAEIDSATGSRRPSH